MAKIGKPNILFIMADDIGWFNLSCYNHGVMGYRTPNMDRIAREGAMFTDFYGQQSCTAGRAALHGFDEFFGNLYHLNAEEEPEYDSYPKDPKFKARFGPRGVLKCKATDKDDATVDPVFGKVGKQTIENSGPLTKKRMETVDEEFLASALDFMERKTKENVPWLCYFNPTRMHVFTHLKPSSVGKTGHGLYPDGMVELDGYVGDLLKKVDDLGVTDNTIVVFTTDNGAEECIWPDGGATPFRGEKDTNWEGGWRVPCVMRWPGVITPGEVINEIGSLTDFLPTFAAAAGDPDIVAKLKKGHDVGGTNFKVHIDGFNLLPFLSGKEPCPRDGFIYWSDDGDLMALRVQQYKIVFAEQNAKGLEVWRAPLTQMRIPKMFDLRSDPFEAGEDSIRYNDWFVEHVPYQYAAQAVVHEWLESFKEFPPRQKAASFTGDQIVEKLMPKS